MPNVTVVSVAAAAPRRLEVALSNGKRLTVDVSAWLGLPGHERLADPAAFAGVTREEWGHGVEWPEIDQGIAVETLIRLAREQAGEAFPAAEFNAWLERNGLSLAQAAAALGLTRRTVIYYHMGHKPIPKHIGLACVGWEALRRRAA